LNIVFDLGGVVFNWQPDKIIQSVFSDVRVRQVVKNEIFGHSDWLELDRGTLNLEQAIDRGALRTRLPRTDINTLMKAVPRHLTPIHETIDLLHAIKTTTDNKLFVLSNIHFASIAYLEKEHSIWELFDGMVISCRVQKVKPDIDIFQYLLGSYSLLAKETVFIDDTDVNLVAASSMGINTVKFENAAQCRKDLSELNCI
jgi:putative hydrolase of the HAD superfamily